MPPKSGGAGGSRLSQLSQQRRQINRTRTEIFNRGVGDVTPGRAAPPPPMRPPEAGPPASPAAAPTNEAAAAGVPDPQTQRAQQLSKVQGFLDQQRAGGQSAPGGLTQAIPTEGAPDQLAAQLETLQAQRLSPEVQFYRIAGRPGSPREIAAFSTRLMLEQQLGRPPTRGEIRMAISRPEVLSPSAQTAFENNA